MICQFTCEAIAGHEVLEDGKTVKFKFVSGEDQVNVVVPGPELDNLIDKLMDARRSLDQLGVGAAAKFQLHIPRTFAIGAHPDQPGTVALTFDMSLPTRIGFMVGCNVARLMGGQFIQGARDAEQLRTRAALVRDNPQRLILPS